MGIGWKMRHVRTQFRQDARRCILFDPRNGFQQFLFPLIRSQELFYFSFQFLNFPLKERNML